MTSSLSSVVSNLVRASMGSSVSASVTDEDLDRHVAELIVREAKKKAERYGQQGIKAYISSNIDSNAPKTNKRFLTSIIKSTDEHNKTILRAQAEAAQEIKREREEQERKQRRARAAEAAEAERLRRSSRSGKRKRGSDDEVWDRWDGRSAERKKVSRNWESWDGRYEDEERRERRRAHRHRRSRSRSNSGSIENMREKRSRSHREEDETGDHKSYRHRRQHLRSNSPTPIGSDKRYIDLHEDSPRREKRKRSRERPSRHSRRSSCSPPVHRPQSQSSRTDDSKRKRSLSPRFALDDIPDKPSLRRSTPPISDFSPQDREVDFQQQSKELRQTVSRSLSPRPDPESSTALVDPEVELPIYSRNRTSPSPSRSPSPGPQPLAQLPSKMDRYFEESYDPRLDVAPLEVPRVPATGLIDNAEFEGWDAMLELIRLRRQDKEEKKRLERLGLLPKENSKIKRKAIVADSGPAVADRWAGQTVSIMDIEYKKRGSVREWDLGKEAL